MKEVRYRIASDLLADPDVKVIEIAHAVGYDDPSHFARAFREISGVSPRAFRANRLRQAGVPPHVGAPCLASGPRDEASDAHPKEPAGPQMGVCS